MKVTYIGSETMMYLHYIDVDAGTTLVAVPGETYDVAPAGGNILSTGTDMPMDGRFVAAQDEGKSKKGHVTSEDTMPSAIKE